jgi:hypothetical protein
MITQVKDGVEALETGVRWLITEDHSIVGSLDDFYAEQLINMQGLSFKLVNSEEPGLSLWKEFS